MSDGVFVGSSHKTSHHLGHAERIGSPGQKGHFLHLKPQRDPLLYPSSMNLHPRRESGQKEGHHGWRPDLLAEWGDVVVLSPSCSCRAEVRMKHELCQISYLAIAWWSRVFRKDADSRISKSWSDKSISSPSLSSIKGIGIVSLLVPCFCAFPLWFACDLTEERELEWLGASLRFFEGPWLMTEHKKKRKEVDEFWYRRGRGCPFTVLLRSHYVGRRTWEF